MSSGFLLTSFIVVIAPGTGVLYTQAALEFAVKYSEERRQFGRPICEFRGLQWTIADMATQLHAARLMSYRAAGNVNEHRVPDAYDTAMARLFASEMVQKFTNEAMQICGHFGYATGAPPERMYRGWRNYASAAGTLEVLRNVIAAMMRGRSFKHRRD
ncbi:MAG: acyl-CoA dehydrogenase family protein [Alphaproteobacteria bacterium]|jgi:alkylation response protein AidB-like acyl-CoA dehydrogenase|nr:acyl-CoA dehydrogenase family protein [Alphaproteobacteria bacterium]MDP6812189.1 acyl-CoA dehydrogenase family protein [Alphaproteobacteria bacterium]